MLRHYVKAWGGELDPTTMLAIMTHDDRDGFMSGDDDTITFSEVVPKASAVQSLASLRVKADWMNANREAEKAQLIAMGFDAR